MSPPVELSVQGMFGQLSHTLKLRVDERVTILTGPNGSGKTQLLKTLRGMVAFDFLSVAMLPLERATLSYADGAWISLENKEGTASVAGRINGRKHGPVSFPAGANDDDEVPHYLERVSDARWYDRRSNLFRSDKWVAERFELQRVPFEQLEWLEPLRAAAKPIIIATGRLDVLAAKAVNKPVRDRPETTSRILQYVGRIRELIGEAKRDSLITSQRADREFAARALKKAKATLKESELRQRYQEISDLNQELHSNGLTEQSIGVEFPARTNPTEKRILNVFLDDWEDKLRPLRPVHEKIQLLRDIVGSKMTMKSMEFDEDGDLRFVSSHGDYISVDMLSSGEQHLLALYTMLLFEAAPGSLVLIDEPEISLHAAWKHAFLSDISRVARLNALQVVVATHSTGIVNGQWDLVEELSVGA